MPATVCSACCRNSKMLVFRRSRSCVVNSERFESVYTEERRTMKRTAVIFAGVAFFCSLGDPPGRLPAGGLPSSPQTVEEPPHSCPVTKPPHPPFLPPPPYPSDDLIWVGSPKLWTNIPGSGTWRGLPHYTPKDRRFRQKLFWWSQGYDWRTENPPQLTITAKRLDGPPPFLPAESAASSGWTNDRDHAFMVVGLFIPALGCWEITGHYRGAELSYVVWVSK